MEKSSILSADLLDILFEGKNKSYGAYELRKTYDRRIAYALTGTTFLCLFFVISSILANGKKENLQAELSTIIELKNFKTEEPKLEIPKPLPKQEAPKIEMVKVTPPIIVADEDVKPEDEVKEIEQIVDTKIGNMDVKGIKEDVVSPPVETIGVAVEAPRTQLDIDKPFTTVQIEAQFPGGINEWSKFLSRNLNKDLPSENGAPPGDYTVTVSFIVDRTGVISDVKAENDPGYGTKTEAIRVIQKGPNWKPAIQNGREVIYRQRQNITFRVSSE